MRQLFVTQDFGPDYGGMARRHVELCRRMTDGESTIEVSTVAAPYAPASQADIAAFDAGEPYRIHRQPFGFVHANRFTNQMRWAIWLTRHCAAHCDVIHCGNIRPVGYAVALAAARTGTPYLVYVNGGDLLRELRKAASRVKRLAAQRILGGAAGVVATSAWVAELTGEVMVRARVENMPPVAALDLGTDPNRFRPGANGYLRKRWGIADAPMLLTVARLVPHKGQDTVIRTLPELVKEFPDLRYVIVGDGPDESRLQQLAEASGVRQHVVFARDISDADLPEAYATATLYVGMSRTEHDLNAEGFGLSFLEASASAIAVIAGDSGGVKSAVRAGETGLLVAPTDVVAAASAIASLLRDPVRRAELGAAGRRAVEQHYNWDRVARDTLSFARDAVAAQRGRRATGQSG